MGKKTELHHVYVYVGVYLSWRLCLGGGVPAAEKAMRLAGVWARLDWKTWAECAF